MSDSNVAAFTRKSVWSFANSTLHIFIDGNWKLESKDKQTNKQQK